MLLLVFGFSFIWMSPVGAFFGDEPDFLPLPDDTQTVIMLEIGGLQSGWDFLHDSKISSVTTLDEIKQQTLFTSFIVSERWNLGLKLNQTEGSVDRTVQPFKIDTKGSEFRIWLGSDMTKTWQWRGYYEHQKTDVLRIECYSLNGRTIGGDCPEAKFIFRNALNPNPDGSLPILPLVELKAEATIVGLEVRRIFISSPRTRLSGQLRVQGAKISSDQNSPLFNLQSPVLLGLSIDGQTLESLREDLRTQLPQDQAWYEYNVTLGLSGAWSINDHWSLPIGFSYSMIKRKDYQERPGIKEIENNFRLDAGILWTPVDNFGVYFKGFITTHNTNGFEPIAYNQRTSTVFDKKYGELALGFVKSF